MSKNSKNDTPRAQFNDARKGATSAFNAFKAWESVGFVAAVAARKGFSTPEFKRALCAALNGSGFGEALPNDLKAVVEGRAYYEERWTPAQGKGKAPSAKDREVIGRMKNGAGKENHTAADNFTKVADIATKAVDEGKDEPAETKEERKLREARELLAKNGYTVAQPAEKPETKAA